MIDRRSSFTPLAGVPQSTAQRVVLISGELVASLDGRVLLDPDQARFLVDVSGRISLGHVDGQLCEMWQVAHPDSAGGLVWHGLRSLIGQVDSLTFRVLGLARQLAEWQQSHRYCGSCGAPTRLVETERALQCEACDLRQYPKLAPCVIVLVTRGEELLLARSSRFRPGFFSTLAGFIEPGESAEECVEREVAEEVGLRIGQLQYLGSQNWPFPNSLMLGFHASYLSGDIVPQPGEIEEADWWHPDHLPGLPPQGSISRWLIDCHLADLRGEPRPPIPH
ncbi:MAG: NAD(+) diphosphatase [Halopseudomonas yangmingensis]